MEAVRLFSSISPVYQALVATLFTWFVTALGAAVVFLKKATPTARPSGRL